MLKKCKKCKKHKDLAWFHLQKGGLHGRRAVCSVCIGKAEKKHRKANKSLYREKYKAFGLRKKQRIKTDKDFDIREWARIWKSRPKENPYRLVQQKFLDSRKAIPIDTLVDLAKEALKHFPYMQFAYKTKTRGYTASIDRIDSSKPYTKDNIKVLPFWLNSAKLDMSYEELSTLIKSVPIEVITSPKERTDDEKQPA